MSEITNIHIYKIAKSIHKETPSMLLKLNTAYKELYKYRTFFHIRKVLREIDNCKIELDSAYKAAIKVLKK